MEITQMVRLRWQRGMCRERTFTVKLADGSAHIYLKDMSKRASWPDFAGSMYGTRDAASSWGDTWSEVLKDVSMKVGTACPAFFYSHDGDLKGLCHGDDFCVVARRKQLQTFGKVLEERFGVKQTGHIGFSACDAKELNDPESNNQNRCAE